MGRRVSEETKPTLSYGRTPRRLRWKLWVPLLIILIAMPALYVNRLPLWNGLQKRLQFYEVLHARRPSPRVTISDASDAGANVSGLLHGFASRVAPWGMAPQNTVHHLALLVAQPSPGVSHGDPATAFIGPLETAEGERRLATVSLNLMVTNDASTAIVSFDVELYGIGSYVDPQFRVVAVGPGATTNPSDGRVYPGFHWIRFDPIRFRPGVACSIDAGAVSTADASVARIAFTLDGTPDAFLFKLGKSDTVTLHLESGRPLPLNAK